MFKCRLSDIFHPKRFLHKIQIQNSTLQTLDKILFIETNQGLGKCLDKATKNQIFTQISQEITDIIYSSNPIMANRRYLADWTCEMATFGIFIIPPEPENDATGLRGTFGITGTLKKHILLVAEKNKELRNFVSGYTNK